MKKLYYEIESNGYHIKDENDPLFHIHQYEPYIPEPTKTYDENAKAQVHEIMVGEYAAAVLSEEMTIDDVPEGFKEEVAARLPKPEPAAHTLDEYADLLAKEVSA